MGTIDQFFKIMGGAFRIFDHEFTIYGFTFSFFRLSMYIVNCIFLFMFIKDLIFNGVKGD